MGLVDQSYFRWTVDSVSILLFCFQKRHRVKALDSKRKGPSLLVSGLCRFEDCPDTVDDEEDLKAAVNC